MDGICWVNAGISCNISQEMSGDNGIVKWVVAENGVHPQIATLNSDSENRSWNPTNKLDNALIEVNWGEDPTNREHDITN